MVAISPAHHGLAARMVAERTSSDGRALVPARRTDAGQAHHADMPVAEPSRRQAVDRPSTHRAERPPQQNSAHAAEQGWTASEVAADMSAQGVAAGGWQPPPFARTEAGISGSGLSSAIDLTAFTEALARMEGPSPATGEQYVDIHRTQRWLEPQHIARVTRHADGTFGLAIAPQLAGAGRTLPSLTTLPERLRAMLESQGRPKPEQAVQPPRKTSAR